jgi:putative ABC transport system substrate-binding protein
MQLGHLKRREFVTLAGAAVAWPLAARGQQAAMPVVGFLDFGSAAERTQQVAAFRKGLTEGTGALAAKAATTTIPIVFGVTGDPVKEGLVASLNRPGGNATGINFFAAELVAKRMQLLREVVPAANRIAVFVNPTDAENYQSTLREVEAAVGGQPRGYHRPRNRRGRLRVSRTRRPTVCSSPQARSSIPGASSLPCWRRARAYAEAGGLMSYGTDILDAFRQVGAYTARILKGTKPVDLPVLQSTKFELVINLNTARALSVEIPPMLLARADEVIE